MAWCLTASRYYLNQCWLLIIIYLCHSPVSNFAASTQIARFMGPTWGPPGSCRPQMGPMLAPWTLLSRYPSCCSERWVWKLHNQIAVTSHIGQWVNGAYRYSQSFWYRWNRCRYQCDITWHQLKYPNRISPGIVFKILLCINAHAEFTWQILSICRVIIIIVKGEK